MVQNQAEKTAERRAKVKALLEQGVSEADICDQTNLSLSYVQKVRQMYGMTRRRGTNRIQVLSELINTDDTLLAIAKQHNCHVDHIARIQQEGISAGFKFRVRKVGRPPKD